MFTCRGLGFALVAAQHGFGGALLNIIVRPVSRCCPPLNMTTIGAIHDDDEERTYRAGRGRHGGGLVVTVARPGAACGFGVVTVAPGCGRARTRQERISARPGRRRRPDEPAVGDLPDQRPRLARAGRPGPGG